VINSSAEVGQASDHYNILAATNIDDIPDAVLRSGTLLFASGILLLVSTRLYSTHRRQPAWFLRWLNRATDMIGNTGLSSTAIGVSRLVNREKDRVSIQTVSGEADSPRSSPLCQLLYPHKLIR